MFPLDKFGIERAEMWCNRCASVIALRRNRNTFRKTVSSRGLSNWKLAKHELATRAREIGKCVAHSGTDLPYSRRANAGERIKPMEQVLHSWANEPRLTYGTLTRGLNALTKFPVHREYSCSLNLYNVRITFRLFLLFNNEFQNVLRILDYGVRLDILNYVVDTMNLGYLSNY